MSQADTNDLAALARNVAALSALIDEHQRLNEQQQNEMHAGLEGIMNAVRELGETLEKDERVRRRQARELRRTKDENRRLKRRISHLLRALEAGETDTDD